MSLIFSIYLSLHPPNLLQPFRKQCKNLLHFTIQRLFLQCHRLIQHRPHSLLKEHLLYLLVDIFFFICTFTLYILSSSPLRRTITYRWILWNRFLFLFKLFFIKGKDVQLVYCMANLFRISFSFTPDKDIEFCVFGFEILTNWLGWVLRYQWEEFWVG